MLALSCEGSLEGSASLCSAAALLPLFFYPHAYRTATPIPPGCPFLFSVSSVLFPPCPLWLAFLFSCLATRQSPLYLSPAGNFATQAAAPSLSKSSLNRHLFPKNASLASQSISIAANCSLAASSPAPSVSA